MKNFVQIMMSLIFLISFCISCNSKPEKLKEIAVINSKFDKIETVLSKYGISYKLYNYSDLENNELYDNYRTIFFPCGVENTIETNIDILSRGTSIHSVSLKKNFLDIDEKKISKNIKSFISNGGNAYFSDYSYKLLNSALGLMEFYDNFPNMGITGTIKLELRKDLMYFHKDEEMKVSMPHPGWIVAKSIQNAETLAESTFPTIRGMKKSPVISLIKTGSCEIIYSSYHKKSDSDIERFIIYRLVYKYLSDKLADKALFWDQQINCTIADSIRQWENYRSYIIPVDKGTNTIYFASEKGPFTINIFDKDKKLIISKDSRFKETNLVIKTNSYQYLIVKIYPGNPKLLGAYSIVSANGVRFIPYYKKALYTLLVIAIIASLFFINKIFGIKKFSGNFKRK